MSILDLMKEYGDDRNQGIKQAILSKAKAILDSEAKYYGTDKHGLSYEQLEDIIKEGIMTCEKQPNSGFNSKGHYQFGYRTCLFCKSDNAELKRDYIWDGSDKNYKYLFQCTVAQCNGVFGSDHK